PLWPEKKLINVAFSEGCFLNVVFRMVGPQTPYPATPCTTQSSGRLKRFCRIKAASGNVLFFAMLLAHTSDPKSL
ncbi:hypothetical protein, partial [Klebsiella michiganensis]